MKLSILFTTLLTILISGAYAQSGTPRVDARQLKQRIRIHEGRQSGELTRGEQVLLNTEQRRIRRTERIVKSDGEVTLRERRILTNQQNRANRHIRRAKHNCRKV